MKKLLSILGAAGLVATTSATVVSCGNTKSNEVEEAYKGDDISKLTKIKISEYNGTKENSKTPKLWLTQDEFNSFKEGKLENKFIAKKLWTGMFDARHGASDEWTKASVNDFNTKKLWTVIHFNGLEEVKEIKGDEWKPTGENQFTLNKEVAEGFGITLDVGVISYTNTKEPIQIGLEESAMNFDNGLIINIV